MKPAAPRCCATRGLDRLRGRIRRKHYSLRSQVPDVQWGQGALNGCFAALVRLATQGQRGRMQTQASMHTTATNLAPLGPNRLTGCKRPAFITKTSLCPYFTSTPCFKFRSILANASGGRNTPSAGFSTNASPQAAPPCHLGTMCTCRCGLRSPYTA